MVNTVENKRQFVKDYNMGFTKGIVKIIQCNEKNGYI